MGLTDSVVTELTKISFKEIPGIHLNSINGTEVFDGNQTITSDYQLSEFHDEATISVWIKPLFEGSAQKMIALSKDRSFSVGINNFVETERNLVFSVFNGAEWMEIESESVLQDSRWVHVAVQINQSEMKMYLNGELENSGTIEPILAYDEKGRLVEIPGKMHLTDSEMIFGGHVYQKGEVEKRISLFTGDVFEAILFDRVLDIQTINEIFVETSPVISIDLNEELDLLSKQSQSSKESVSIFESISLKSQISTDYKKKVVIISDIIDILGLISNVKPVIFDGVNIHSTEDKWGDAIEDMSISAWVKPQYNHNSAYSVLSKDNSFNLRILNELEPNHRVEFSLFDGISWKTFTGTTIIDEHWNHVLVTVTDNKVRIYINGQPEIITFDEGVGYEANYDEEIIFGESKYFVGATQTTIRDTKISDKFVGHIGKLDLYTIPIDENQAELVYQTESNDFRKSISVSEKLAFSEEILLEDPNNVTVSEVMNFSILVDAQKQSKLVDIFEFLEFSASIETEENLIFLDESLEISDKINTKSEVIINETLLLKSKTFGLPSNHILILESIFFDDSIHAMSPSQIMLDENLEFETKVIRFNPFDIEIYEKLFLSDSIGFHPPIIKLDENLKILDSIRVFDEYEIVLYEKIEFNDIGEIYDGIHLIEKITFDDKIISYNPFEPVLDPSLKLVKSGFAINEVPEFEIQLLFRRAFTKS